MCNSLKCKKLEWALQSARKGGVLIRMCSELYGCYHPLLSIKVQLTPFIEMWEVRLTSSIRSDRRARKRGRSWPECIITHSCKDVARPQCERWQEKNVNICHSMWNEIQSGNAPRVNEMWIKIFRICFLKSLVEIFRICFRKFGGIFLFYF